MAAYILRRLLLVIPTLFGIMVVNFTLVFGGAQVLVKNGQNFRDLRGPGVKK